MRIFIREKIRIQKTNDKKKEEAKPKLSGEKNVSTKVFRVLRWFKVWEYPLRAEAVLRQYYQFFKVKIYSGTDNFQTTLRQFQRYMEYQIGTKSKSYVLHTFCILS